MMGHRREEAPFLAASVVNFALGILCWEKSAAPDGEGPRKENAAGKDITS